MTDDFNFDDLKKKADLEFEAYKDIDTLKKYLEAVTGDKVALANFTASQVKGLMKIMGIDKLYLEPSEDIGEKENVCKNIVKMAVTVSKSKDAYGLEALRDILLSRVRLNSEGSEVLQSEVERKAEGDESD